MKNLVMGICGCAIAVYTIVCCLSIYSISSRRNELENCVSQVVRQNLMTYYGGFYSDAEVEAYVRQDLTARLCSDSRVTIAVSACDMAQGILSVSVTEEFFLPNGMRKLLRCDKTAIVEVEEIWTDDSETETEIEW